jgi:hypothetical protein
MREKRTARYTNPIRTGMGGYYEKNLTGTKYGKDLWKTRQHYKGG